MLKRHLVLFDMDNTLVSADTVGLWSDFLKHKGLLDADELAKWDKFHEDYVRGCLDVNASFCFELSIFKKIPIDRREPWLQELFQEHILPKISRAGLRLIEAYKRQPNTLVILITATLAFIARHVADYTQVDDLIATQPEIINGEYTGFVSGIPSLGSGKAQRYEQWLEKNQITPLQTVLYSDSINDLPLLSLVKKPIVVDPDEKLHHIALLKNWPIISLRNPQHNDPLLEPVVLDEQA